MSEPVDSRDVEIRSLNSPDDYDQCVRLQRDIWGQRFTEVVPPTMLKITQKVGGVAVGAFRRAGDIVGFVYGVSGVRGGRPAHWSHMLAVRTGFENMGLGKRLKVRQRDLLLELGIEVCYWSYDPLVARNAHLNLNRLGARTIEYVVDMYGNDTHSALHSGLGTDRFVVEWELRHPRVDRVLSSAARGEPAGVADLPIVSSHAKGGRILPTEGVLPEVATARIEVPEDIQLVKSKSLELGLKWRTTTRRAFLWYLGRRYRVVAFYRDKSSARCFYVVSREGGWE
jgi:predicted GNAT superfamily acetyltransferase